MVYYTNHRIRPGKRTAPWPFYLYMKEFKTYNQQIDILKERGLSFVDEDDAKFFLQGENYYDKIWG